MNACNKTRNTVMYKMYMCASLSGLSIGVWGCLDIVIFFDDFLSIFYSIE